MNEASLAARAPEHDTPDARPGERRGAAVAAGLAAVIALTGCSHIGPRTIALDRFDYSSAIADSWKQQTLLNIVKLRYLDLPVFVDVSSIVSGYSLQTGVNVAGTLSADRAVDASLLSAGAQGIYIDRPTITYIPMTGDKFLRGLVTPIDPKAIFSMLQSGYEADFVLALTVESLNGVCNRSAVAGRVREADPEFARVLGLLRDVQAAGGIAMRVVEDKAKGSTGEVFFRREHLPPGTEEKIAEIRRLLRMPAEQRKFTLIYSPVRGAEGELAVGSRSILQVMGACASYVEVPPVHLKEQRALPGPKGSPDPGGRQAVCIHSGRREPSDAYVAVPYRGHWFWVDDRDWQSKRALTAIMFFFTLTETSGSDRVPLVTIPAQ